MYYKTFESPVFRVPIAEIFSSTVATIVLHPLDYVVGKLGSSFKEFIGKLNNLFSIDMW